MRKKVQQRILNITVTSMLLLSSVFPVAVFADQVNATPSINPPVSTSASTPASNTIPQALTSNSSATLATPTTNPFTVALLGTSDIHGQMMGWDYFQKKASTGMTRLATLVAQERAKYPNNVLVDAGDEIQGTPLVYYYDTIDKSWVGSTTNLYPMINAFNYMKYDTLVLGNHEFNFGLDVLKPLIAQAKALNMPYLSANTLDSTATASDPVTGDKPTWSDVKPYTIKNFTAPDGSTIKVAVLGLTTPDIPYWESPTHYTGLQWGDIVTEGTKWVHYLKDDPNGPQVNAVIAAIHSGEGVADPSTENPPNENEVLAFANANPEVDTILCGHTHVTLNQQEGTNKIWMVEPKNAASNLEEVVMNFTKNTAGKWTVDPTTETGTSLSASTSVPEDQGLVNLLQPAHQATLQYLQTSVGNTTAAFNADGQTIKDTALMDLVNKVQMHYGSAQLSVGAPFSPTAAIPKGTVNIADISSVYIYENYLYSLKVTGAQLKKYMEFSVGRYYQQYQPGDTSIKKNSSVPDYNLDVLQGANYTVDLTKKGLYDANGNSLAGGEPRIYNMTFNGQPVDDNTLYTLALNDYRFNGGGGFLAAAGIVPQTTAENAPGYITYDSRVALGQDGQVRSLMMKYFQDVAAGKITGDGVTGTSVTPTCDNNWETVPRFYDLLEYTDVHGSIDNSPATKPQKNAALMSGLVNMERATYGDERTALLSGGDMMQGTPISNVLKGKPVIDWMNEIGFETMTVGNHEFDWGNDVLDQNLKNSSFPFLVANMKMKDGDTDPSATKLLSDAKPYTILNKDGLKIGVIGVITPDTANIVMPSIVGHYTFDDPATIINALVPKVKAAGADIVIVVAHIGDQSNSFPSTGQQPTTEPFGNDPQNLAYMTHQLHGVTAVFGGHSHTYNYDLLTDADGNKIPAVIGAYNAYGAGDIKLALDANNKIVAAIPTFLDLYNRLNSSVTPDPAAQAIVDAANAQIGPVFTQVIGQAAVDLTRTTASSGYEDSNLGDWAADITAKVANTDFGFQNAGGIRCDLPKGPITVGDIWTLMPFDNDVDTANMTGTQIKSLLDYLVTSPKGIGHISGLHFVYNKSQPTGSKIVSLTKADGSPLVPDQVYTVAGPDFVLTGGDTYPFPTLSTNLQDSHVLVRDAMLNDIKARGTLNYQPDGRIQEGTGSTSGAASIPVGTVVFSNGQALDLNYANNPAYLQEVTQDVVASSAIYIISFDGSVVNNKTGAKLNASEILTLFPAVTYKDAKGKTRKFNAGNGPEVSANNNGVQSLNAS
ncbi:putative 5'-nucleotidase [Candidatus Desulfosporosinus infrequens]|uniref:Putative 5'-nucleotidase n=1 Tax=Candidatus Desulfosporosinus infrequens TaxID=2043169 RepID=A0A2U3KKE1_9FIRM|nr:putative 5'-nucleotidase [Candidatus Desulfosporosinus infrequens]